MDDYQLGKDIAGILARLDALEDALNAGTEGFSGVKAKSSLSAFATELFGPEPLTVPPRVAVEPFETQGSTGKWRCDPKVISVLKLNGGDIPYRSLVLYSAEAIQWTPHAGGPTYTTACPRSESGGVFPFKLHALVFGLGARGVGCQSGFGIEGSPGSPVWVAVNDDSYTDNDGSIVVRVRWR